jgi:hypothetical protein
VAGTGERLFTRALPDYPAIATSVVVYQQSLSEMCHGGMKNGIMSEVLSISV